MRDQHVITGPIITDPTIMIDGAVSLPSTATPSRERQRYFDEYWNTRNLATVDHRTRLRMGLVDALLDHPGGTLLDVGCGRGCTAAYFADSGFNVSAVDLSPMAVEWTRRQHHKIKAAVLDLESDAIVGYYDVILCLEVLQQVRQPVECLKKLAAALSEDGEIVISLPNEFHLARRFNIVRGKVDFGGIEDSHLKLYTVVEHRRLLDACGLDIIDRRTQSIVPPSWWGGRVHAMTNGLASNMPGLFALSVIYKCRVAT